MYCSQSGELYLINIQIMGVKRLNTAVYTGSKTSAMLSTNTIYFFIHCHMS